MFDQFIPKSQATRSRVMRTNPSHTHTHAFIKYLKLLHRSKEPAFLFLQGDQSFASLKNARPLTAHLIMSAVTTLLLPSNLIFYPPGSRADQGLLEPGSPLGIIFAHPHTVHSTLPSPPQIKRTFSSRRKNGITVSFFPSHFKQEMYFQNPLKSLMCLLENGC